MIEIFIDTPSLARKEEDAIYARGLIPGQDITLDIDGEVFAIRRLGSITACTPKEESNADPS